MKMTFIEAKRELEQLGVRITKVEGSNPTEYKVNLIDGGTEASAYYTDDLTDAHSTGMDMAHRQMVLENS